MNFRPRILTVCCTLSLFCLTSLAAYGADAKPAPHRTALDEYVHKQDGAFEWKVVHTITDAEAGVKVHLVDLKSQRWRTKDEVNRTVWQHWLTVVVPDEVVTNKGFLMIGGGRNGRKELPKPNDMTVKIALASKSVVAELGQVPNQSLIFHGDGKERVEDDLIGYTWDQFLKTGDKNWPARNPMVKSAVRAMDAITELMASPKGGQIEVNEFVVAGGSKRGWTTWITGAVDKRVVAIVPIVIDVLNVNTSMKHHFAAYGFWAPAVGDYFRHKIMQRMDDPKLDALYSLVDPFSYRDRLTMPKFIVNASGDQFFLPDSSQFYFDELKGEKHLRYVPNADHSLRDTDALQSIIAFYMMIIHNKPRPEFDWTFEDDGSIVVKPTEQTPAVVKLWHAHNPQARDFRVESLGRKYQEKELTANSKGEYVARIAQPKSGWSAFFVELTYDTGFDIPLKFTTAVRVLPDVLPYSDRDPLTGKLGKKPRRD